MCYSHATIFYGLFVRSFDLVCAIDACKKLEPAFKAVDLIELRRRTGKLEVEGATRVGNVPIEVRGMVKEELAGLAVVGSKNQLISKFRCEDCVRLKQRPETLLDLTECEPCFDDFLDAGGVTTALDKRRKKLDKLLETCGLYLPSTALVTRDTYFFDWEALSALAVSPPSSSSPLPNISPEGREMDAHVGHEVTPFDPSLITSIPPTASARLRSFVRLFRLEVVDPSSYLKSADSEASRTTSDREEMKVEPRWQLWGSATCC